MIKISTSSPDPKSLKPLRCYVCDSSENKECGSEDTTVLDQFDTACNDISHTNCHISKETFTNGTMTTKRFCNIDRHTPCNQNKEISSVCYCACNENLCNVNDPANDKNSCLFGVRKNPSKKHQKYSTQSWRTWNQICSVQVDFNI